MTISFKGAHFPRDVILHAVFFYLRYGVSYRDLEEIMAERGVDLDHATLNRWVSRYAGLIAETARYRKRPTDRSWRMDETYVKVKGEWVYLYRAIDKHGKTLDFMLSERRNKPAATRFFARALEVNGLPRKIVIDKSGANTAGIKAINKMLKSFGCPIPIEIIRRKGSVANFWLLTRLPGIPLEDSALAKNLDAAGRLMRSDCIKSGVFPALSTAR